MGIFLYLVVMKICGKHVVVNYMWLAFKQIPTSSKLKIFLPRKMTSQSSSPSSITTSTSTSKDENSLLLKLNEQLMLAVRENDLPSEEFLIKRYKCLDEKYVFILIPKYLSISHFKVLIFNSAMCGIDGESDINKICVKTLLKHMTVDELNQIPSAALSFGFKITDYNEEIRKKLHDMVNELNFIDTRMVKHLFEENEEFEISPNKIVPPMRYDFNKFDPEDRNFMACLDYHSPYIFEDLGVLNSHHHYVKLTQEISTCPIWMACFKYLYPNEMWNYQICSLLSPEVVYNELMKPKNNYKISSIGINKMLQYMKLDLHAHKISYQDLYYIYDTLEGYGPKENLSYTLRLFNEHFNLLPYDENHYEQLQKALDPYITYFVECVMKNNRDLLYKNILPKYVRNLYSIKRKEGYCYQRLIEKMLKRVPKFSRSILVDNKILPDYDDASREECIWIMTRLGENLFDKLTQEDVRYLFEEGFLQFKSTKHFDEFIQKHRVAISFISPSNLLELKIQYCRKYNTEEMVELLAKREDLRIEKFCGYISLEHVLKYPTILRFESVRNMFKDELVEVVSEEFVLENKSYLLLLTKGSAELRRKFYYLIDNLPLDEYRLLNAQEQNKYIQMVREGKISINQKYLLNYVKASVGGGMELSDENIRYIAENMNVDNPFVDLPTSILQTYSYEKIVKYFHHHDINALCLYLLNSRDKTKPPSNVNFEFLRYMFYKHGFEEVLNTITFGNNDKKIAQLNVMSSDGRTLLKYIMKFYPDDVDKI